MEYFLGSLITLMSLFVFNIMLKRIINEKIPAPVFTQSRKVSLIKNYLISMINHQFKVKTQANNYVKRNSTKAFFLDDNVYWIEQGFLVTAKIIDNKIDEQTKKRVDTYTLDKVELDKITFIVDKLTEGNKNDSGNSGK